MDVFSIDNMQPLFSFLENTKGVMQKSIHHPEGDVFNHSLQVLHWAFRESQDIDLIIAAMMHDVGKIVNSYDHPSLGAELLRDYCSAKTLFLIAHHMRIRDYVDGTMHKLGKVQFLAHHSWLPELVQLARWDKKGRNPDVTPRYDREEIVSKLNVLGRRYFKKVIGY